MFDCLIGWALAMGVGPGYMRLLEVPGRKSGKIIVMPINLLEFEDRRWLVSARGKTLWVGKVRATGRVVLRRGFRAESFKVRELADDEKPQVLKACLDCFASLAQRFFE